MLCLRLHATLCFLGKEPFETWALLQKRRVISLLQKRRIVYKRNVSFTKETYHFSFTKEMCHGASLHIVTTPCAPARPLRSLSLPLWNMVSLYLSVSLSLCLSVSLSLCVSYPNATPHEPARPPQRGGGLGSRPKKMYGERLGDGVEYHLMKPTPRR